MIDRDPVRGTLRHHLQALSNEISYTNYLLLELIICGIHHPGAVATFDRLTDRIVALNEESTRLLVELERCRPRAVERDGEWDRLSRLRLVENNEEEAA